MESPPQDIASLEPPPLVVFTITLVILFVTIVLASRKKDKEARQRQLRQWIVRARQERAQKQHKCLEEEIVVEDSDGNILTAVETRDRVASGDLDPSIQVVTLSKRCRQYGRDEKRANAITEEFYDEVSINKIKTYSVMKNCVSYHFLVSL